MQKSRVYLEDILAAIQRIERYLRDVQFQQFTHNQLLADAVVRNLEIIGEAVKKLSTEFRQQYPEIEWKKIAGLRDFLIHSYSEVDLGIVWNIITTKLPPLEHTIRNLLESRKLECCSTGIGCHFA